MKAFISYAGDDRGVARRIARLLETIGVDYFLDEKHIRLGDSITEEVRRGVESSDVLLVVISPASLKSPWGPFEIGHANALGKRVIPYLTHPRLDTPPFLSGLNQARSLKTLRIALAQIEPAPRSSIARPDCEAPLELVDVGSGTVMDRVGTVVQADVTLVTQPARVLFPVLDFKFRNPGDRVAFLKRLRLHIEKVSIDLTPLLEFYIHSGAPDSDISARKDRQDLVITAKNAGWGPARNVIVTNLTSSALRQCLDLSAAHYRWTGDIEPGETVRITYHHQHIRSDSDVTVTEPGGFLTYEDASGARFAEYIRYTPYPYEEYKVVVRPEGFTVRYHDFAAAREPSRRYTLQLPSAGAPYTREIEIAHDIPGNDVERFQVIVASDKSATFELTAEILFNVGASVTSAPLRVCVFYPNPLWYFHYHGIRERDVERRISETRRTDADVRDAFDETAFSRMYLRSANRLRWPCSLEAMASASPHDLKQPRVGADRGGVRYRFWDSTCSEGAREGTE